MVVSSIIAATPANFPDGFYDSAKVNEIYNAGVSSQEGFAGADVTYRLVHQHINASNNPSSNSSESVQGGCYTKARTYSYTTTEAVWESYTATEDDGSGGYRNFTAWRQVPKTVTHYATVYDLDCGFTANEFVRETDDYSSIQANEKIESVTVNMY